MNSIRTKTYILILMSLGYFATDVYLPSLPAIGRQLQVDESWVQLSIFSYILSFSVFPLIAGPLSDNLGRKKVIAFGLILSLIATFGACFKINVTWLILMRFFQGVGNASILIANRSMITDLFHGEELAKQISYISMMMPLMLAVAPVIGGYLQEQYDWQVVFIFMTFFLFLLVATLPVLQESHRPTSYTPLKKVGARYLVNFKNIPFVLYGICMGLPSFGVFAFLTSGSYIFQEHYSLTPMQYGRVSIAIGCAIALSSFLNTKLISHFKSNQLITLAALCALLAGILIWCLELFHVHHWLVLLIPSMLYFAVLPICGASAVSKSISYIESDFGTANAMLSTGQFLFSALASLIFSFLPEQSSLPIAQAYILSGALLFLVSIAAHRYGLKYMPIPESNP